MADEPKPDTPKPLEPKDSGKVVFDSQEDFDAVIERRLAKERKKYEDYDTLQSELVKLREEERKRKEAELGEIDKLKAQIKEKEEAITELNPFKEKWTAHEDELTLKVDKAIESFSDEDKELILALPLDKRMAMVEKLRPQDKGNVNINKGLKIPGIMTTQDLMNLRKELGPNDPRYIKALRESRGH